MNKLEEILAVSGDELFKVGEDFDKKWGKRVNKGHTKYHIRDMIGEGHGHLIPAAKYFHGCTEVFNRINQIPARESQAMDTQAKLNRAVSRSLAWWKLWSKFVLIRRARKLEIKAELMRQEQSLKDQVLSIKRVKTETENIYNEMMQYEPEVMAKYDGDVEKAQHDIFLSKMHYMSMKGERLDNIPLSPEEKAVIGLKYGRHDAAIALSVKTQYEAGWPQVEGPKDGQKVHRIPDRQREGMA